MPVAPMMRLSRRQRLNDISGTVRGSSRKRQTPSPSTAENRKRIDAPISPEMAPEAPTIGASSVGLTARNRAAPARPNNTKQRTEPRGADPMRDGAAERQQPSRVDAEVGQVPVHQHMSEE